MPVVKKKEWFFVSAGEVSGDLLGADLVSALRSLKPHAGFFGITGPAMEKAGVESVASINELNVMGFAEVAKKALSLRLLESRLLCQVERRLPLAAILIDNPGLHFRLAEHFKMRQITNFQYVAPKVWAWGSGRIKALRRDFDAVLGVLPFERDFFLDAQVPYQYVGSPHKDRTEKINISKDDLSIDPSTPLIACLPGSRISEVSRIFPVITAIKQLICGQCATEPAFVIPIASGLSVDDFVRCAGGRTADIKASSLFKCNAHEWNGFHFVSNMSLEVLAVADCAIVASGTATLECALLQTPMVVLYAMNVITYKIAQRLVKLRDYSLVNLVAQRTLVREFIQQFSAREVAAEVCLLMETGEARNEMIKNFSELRDGLQGNAGLNAAHLILECLSKKSSKCDAE